MNTKELLQRNLLFISTAVMVTFVMAISAFLLVVARPDFSDVELRKLEEPPTFTVLGYMDGSYFAQFTSYFSDTVPMRETWVTWAGEIRQDMGISTPTFYGNTVVVNNDPPPMPAPQELAEEENSEDTEEGEAEAEEEPEVEEEPEPEHTGPVPIPEEPKEEVEQAFGVVTNGIMVDGIEMYGLPAGVMLFGGNYDAGLRYATVLNKYKEVLGDEVNVYDMLVPTSSEFYLPAKFSSYSASQKNAIDYMYANLSRDIIAVDAYSKLEEHKDEEIYFRTDHHWTPLGAYYAYTAFAETIGDTYPPITSYTRKMKENFSGSLYGYTNDVRLKNVSEDFVYYMPNGVEYTTYLYDYTTLAYKGETMLYHEYAAGANMYSMFLGGDNLHVKITTDNTNGRSIIVLKESYGNAVIPFLVSNFEEIYVVDIRYFGGNVINYIRDNEITDLLFINYSLAANTHMQIDRIENLMTK